MTMNDDTEHNQSASAAQALTKTRRKPPRASITHLRHWEQRIFKPRYTRGRVEHQSDNWAVEIQFGGERGRWSLGTPNKAAAASRAQEIYLFLSRHGWAATEEKFQKKAADKKKDLSVGQYSEAVLEVVPASKTLRTYVQALHKIAADVAGIDAGKAKYDYCTG